jgi:hypothetical protein
LEEPSDPNQNLLSNVFLYFKYLHKYHHFRLQKFGVHQKEKIASYKSSIDVLTLSATPIPRTLYLALTGFRDARYAVLIVDSTTYTCNFTFLPIKRKILRSIFYFIFLFLMGQQQQPSLLVPSLFVSYGNTFIISV